MANMDNQMNPYDPRLAGAMGQQPQPPGQLPPGQMPPQPNMGGGQVPGGVPPGTGPAQPYQLNQQTAQAATSLPSQDMMKFQLSRQYKLADALRADAKNQMQGQMMGRVYSGPKWWDALGSGVDDALAMKQDLKSSSDAADFGKKQSAAALKILQDKGLLAPSTAKTDKDSENYYTG